QGLEQAAQTFGLIRSLNLTGASVDITVDCLVMGAFRSST
ncbi:IS1595 family transposase, partial [Halorubrum sp. GN11_10-6_MGM]